LASELLGEVLCVDGGESAEASGGLDVTDQTDDLHGGALNDRHGLDDVLLENLLTLATFVVTSDVSHTSLISHEGGKVDGLRLVVLGEGSYSAAVVSCPASRQESK